MKILVLVARLLLGLMFGFFGLNGFFQFLPMGEMPPGDVGRFLSVFMSTHYTHVVSFFQVVCGVLLLVNRYVPLALTVLAAIIVNILTFHILMAPATIAPGLLAAILWVIVFWRVRSNFAGVFDPRGA